MRPRSTIFLLVILLIILISIPAWYNYGHVPNHYLKALTDRVTACRTAVTQNISVIVYSRTISDPSVLKLPSSLPPQCLIAQSREPLSFEMDKTAATALPFANITLPGLRDRLSPNSFKRAAEIVYGDGKKPDDLYYTMLTMDIIPCLQPGVIIHVEGTWIGKFKQEILPHLSVPFVLVTGDTDDSAPGPYTSILDSPHLLHWYGQNCDVDYSLPKAQKLFTCLPMGNSQWSGQGVRMDQVLNNGERFSNIVTNYLRGKLIQRSKLLLVSFSVASHPDRGPALDHLKTLPFATVDFVRNRNLAKFYQKMADYQFIASPRGGGLDCYRTWEALYLGCAVIVKSSSLDSLYTYLPVLIVKEWEEVTQDRLDEIWTKFRDQSFDYSSLFMGHWERKFYRDRVQPDHTILRYHYSLKTMGDMSSMLAN